MENIPIKYEKRIIALYEMSISISDPDVHWSETVPQDQKMPDCLSSKGIGWLGDRGRKGGRLASGNTTPLQTRGRAFLLFFKKKKMFYSQVFYTPGFSDLLDKIRRNVAFKQIHGPRVPKRPESFSANVPRFNVILGSVSVT